MRERREDRGTGPAAEPHQGRRFPLRRPEGLKPPIPRYSAVLAPASKPTVLFLGVQSKSAEILQKAIGDLFQGTSGDAPVYVDYAIFTDKRGYLNRIAALYWLDVREFVRWCESPDLAVWRAGMAETPSVGFWWEPIVVNASRMETITFEQFRRGFSGCPHLDLATTTCSGYWGAARDRVPAAAHDLFEPTVVAADPVCAPAELVVIRPPKNMVVIRSGVSWEDCEGEQLRDYQEHIKPRLDAGMEFLRDHPRETGCFSLRQVRCLSFDGVSLAEAYSLGAFVSMDHLETWAKDHPTHLAIYMRAMAARRKYQEKLQLRTYNEIFIVDADNPPFEYVHCHADTGLMPYAQMFNRPDRNENLCASWA